MTGAAEACARYVARAKQNERECVAVLDSLLGRGDDAVRYARFHALGANAAWVVALSLLVRWFSPSGKPSPWG